MPKKRKLKQQQTDQHFWKEILIQPEIFSPEVEMPHLSETEQAVIKEAKITIRELLLDRMREIVNKEFTTHQKVVLNLIMYPDRTYNDTAEFLDCNYTGVSHAIKGIKSNKHGGKFHGGYERKLKKHCERDDECQEYIACVRILRNNNPKDALEILIKYDDDCEIWEQLHHHPELWTDPNFWKLFQTT